MNYQDFDLVIDRVGENLRAQVIDSPAGQAAAEFQLPFSEDKLENFLLRLGGRSRRATTRRVETQEMTAAKAFGAALFGAVFASDVKACFRSSVDEARRQNAGLRIRLRLADPSVVDLPWEYLYNPAVNRFLALSIQTPLVRYVDLPERIQPISVTPPIRVLVMISSPTDFPALDIEAEWTRLNEALADLISRNQIAVDRLDDATLEALQRRLRRERYHIFHFIGHGEFDDNSQEGALIFAGDQGRGHRVSSQSLGMMLHDHESLRVAILNACEGARTSRTDPFAGSAQSLVQQGIPAVIAMQFEIADDVASRFAREFYGALADGYPIDASLTEARKSIFAARHEVEWGTPVLYLRAPDGRIFDVDTVVPPKPLTVVESGPQVVESSTRLTQEQITQDVVTAARAAVAGGRRAEAIELLRRYEPAKEAVAEALRELTLERQLTAAEKEHRLNTPIEKAEKELRAADESLESGTEFDPSQRAAMAGLQEVVVPDPDNATLRPAVKGRRKPLRSSRLRAGTVAVLRSGLTMAAVALALAAFVGIKVIPPALSRWRAASQQAQVQPSPTVAPPRNPVTPPPATDPEPAPTRQPDPAPPVVTPVEDNSKLKEAVEEARRRAVRARASAVRAKASGLPRFRAADDAMARGSELATEGQFEESGRAYSNAATLFLRALDDVETALASRDAGGTRGNATAGTPSNSSGKDVATPSAPVPTPTDKPAETGARRNTDPLPADPVPQPPKNDPPKVTPIRVRPTIESAIRAYATAMASEDTEGLLSVYPSASSEALESLKRTDTGAGTYTLSINAEEIRYISPTRARADCILIHSFTAAGSGKAQTKQEERAITLERRNESWDIIDVRRR